MQDILKWTVYTGVFAVPFVVFLVADSLFFPYITGKNFTFRIIVEIVFAAWLLLALYDPRYRPRFSWTAVAFIGLLIVMFFANILGEYPLKSFWSNFERMEGYVTLVHLFMYFIVMGSVMNSKLLWDRFFNVTLIAAATLSFYTLAQSFGASAEGANWRIEGTLGNSTYMAIYMLFHVFIAALMAFRTSSRKLRYAYSALAVFFVLVLIQTGTRGAMLGLVGGTVLSAIYIALFAREYPLYRKIAAGVLVSLALLVGAFIAARDSSFVQNDPRLARMSEINLDAGSTRFTIWSVALEGVKERPILGWGQDNFNYVFNAKYDPSLYAQEAWFDRVHNIVLDWLIAGGIVGAFFYFSLIGTAVFYAAVRPIFKRNDEAFPVAERALLLGLLAAYVFHNLFVFDNLISYMFFAVMLAYIHSSVGTNIPALVSLKISESTTEKVVLPIVLIVAAGTLYFVNVPGILAGKGIINALMAPTADERFSLFDRAIERDSFANQEIREQMTLQALNVFRSTSVNENEKGRIYNHVHEELQKQAEEKPGDARVYTFLAMLHRGANNTEAVLENIVMARALSPKKQSIIYEEAFARIEAEQFEVALSLLKEAYELDRSNEQARIMYAIGALYAKDQELIEELIDNEERFVALARTDLALEAAYFTGAYELAEEIFQFRINENPDNVQLQISFSAMLNEIGESQKAIEVIEKAIDVHPQFEEQLRAFIEEIRKGSL